MSKGEAMQLEEIVRSEYRRFTDKLPELLKVHAGKWVVFKDGSVQSAHDSQHAAIGEAVSVFGVNGGFVVAEVAEIKAIPLTAAVMFGHSAA